MLAPDLKSGMRWMRLKLLQDGVPVKTTSWQGQSNPPEMVEEVHAGFRAPMYETEVACLDNLVDKQYKDWAPLHHSERIGGVPLNPPPSHQIWKGASESMSKRNPSKFSHTYPERFWEDESLGKLVDLLKHEPDTRQAYLPMYLQKDLDDSLAKERVPCSLGWHFMLRDKKLHCFYPMRSLDATKHFGNDLYFVNMLTLWIIREAGLDAVPGTLNFQVTSFHYFKVHEYALRKLCS
jgi:hypothetical protein